MTRGDLTEDLLHFLRTPHTMAQIREQFGEGPVVRWTVYNAVARGDVINLNAGEGRKVGGRFQATRGNALARGPGRPPKGEPLQLDWRTGAHLQQVWQQHGGARA